MLVGETFQFSNCYFTQANLMEKGHPGYTDTITVNMYLHKPVAITEHCPPPASASDSDNIVQILCQQSGLTRSIRLQLRQVQLANGLL
ncbi:hypothetical protein E2C01_029860 [Portunus trituberculatus]|uniref:Uncharacterized protein n=1 Tax=Portunus trituberculatus TaxID=210409 RepID=A0A5B7EU26_PORTR|nr:hypothetical protein [Portunus trituberculatus]